MRGSPIGENVSLEAEFVLQPAVLGQGVLRFPYESQTRPISLRVVTACWSFTVTPYLASITAVDEV